MGRNSWERVYPQTKVLPQFPEVQHPISWSRNTRTDRTRSKQHRRCNTYILPYSWGWTHLKRIPLSTWDKTRLWGTIKATGKMPVYRAPSIFLLIHRDTATFMAQGPPAKPPHPPFFGKAKRRTSSRSQSKGRFCYIPKYINYFYTWLRYFIFVNYK